MGIELDAAHDEEDGDEEAEPDGLQLPPNGGDLPKWPSYNAKDDTVLELGDKIEAVNHLHKDEITFLDAFMVGQAVSPVKK